MHASLPHGSPVRGRSFVLVALTLLGACSESSSVVRASFATYNAGLAAGFVDYALERAPVNINAVAGLDADVVCVQEVWQPEDVQLLQRTASDAFPNQIFREPEPSMPMGGEPACPPAEADPLEACAREHCGDATTDELVSCVLGNCGEEFNATSSMCQECLGAQVGNTLDDILLACGSGPGGAYAYGGSFGIGLLTRGEIVEQDALVLDSTYNRRVVQYARLALSAATVDVFCTHLSAVFDDIIYPRDDGSWAEEQAAQIQAMRAFVDEHSGAAGGVVLLGDFNTGPAAEGIAAEVPENYEALVAGYDNAYLEQPAPLCTFCADNPLVGGADDDESVIIDHILTRDLAGEVVSTERVLDGTIELQTFEAGTITTAYSDHYGVKTTIAFESE